MTPEEYAEAHDLTLRGVEEAHDLTFAQFTGDTTFYTLVTERGNVDGLRLETITPTHGSNLVLVEGEEEPRRIDSVGIHEKQSCEEGPVIE